MMAYVTRYIFGTDKLRANSFEVRGMNGSNTGVIHVTDLAILSKWMKIISEYTNALTSQKVQHSNICSDSLPQFKLIFYCRCLTKYVNYMEIRLQQKATFWLENLEKIHMCFRGLMIL